MYKRQVYVRPEQYYLRLDEKKDFINWELDEKMCIRDRYSPTEWVPSYYVYLPRIPTPDMFYAVARIQNPRGMWDYAVAFVKGRFKKKEAHQ